MLTTLTLTVLVSTCLAGPLPSKLSMVGMSYFYDNETINWPGTLTYRQHGVYRGPYNDFWYEEGSFSTSEHAGTHMDAPAHFAKGKWRIHEIPVTHLFGPAAIIDISEPAASNPDAQVMPEDLLEWEAKYGRFPSGSIVFMYSGWGAKWPNREAYFGSTTYNDTSTLHFPGFHPNATQWLLTQRQIFGIGVDTPSLDYGQSTTFITHRLAYAENIYGLENVANLNQLPPMGADVVVMPMNIRDGSGAPCRIVGLLPQTNNALNGVTASCVSAAALVWILVAIVSVVQI